MLIFYYFQVLLLPSENNGEPATYPPIIHEHNDNMTDHMAMEEKDAHLYTHEHDCRNCNLLPCWILAYFFFGSFLRMYAIACSLSKTPDFTTSSSLLCRGLVDDLHHPGLFDLCSLWETFCAQSNVIRPNLSYTISTFFQSHELQVNILQIRSRLLLNSLHNILDSDRSIQFLTIRRND